MNRLGLPALQECLAGLTRTLQTHRPADSVDRGLQIVDPAQIAVRYHPVIEPTLPLLLPAVDVAAEADGLQAALLNLFPADHPVLCFATSDIAEMVAGEEKTEARQLGTLTVEPWPHTAVHLYLPPLPHADSIGDLQELVAHLRAPDGCPWDRVQTLATLRQDLLGEAVEVLEAVDAEQDGGDNSEHIAEELGDLLLLVTMMVQIATEEGRFKMPDVTRHVVHKLVRRHPHVFGEEEVDGIDAIYTNWDAIKAQEKADKGLAPAGPLDGVPAHLPALEKARKLQSKAAKAGLLNRAALAATEPALGDILGPAPDAERLGALLWQLVALAHEHNLNAEDALRTVAVGYRHSIGSSNAATETDRE